MRASGQHVPLGPVAVGLAAVVAALDVLTKQLAEERLGEPVELVLGAQLSLSHNSGVAFGVLSGAPVGAVFAAVLLALAALTAGVVRGWLPASAPAVGLLAGGAVANLVDRAPDGRVTDFIDLPHWPSFNVADIAITLAVLLLVLRSFRDDASDTTPSTTQQPTAA